MFILRLLALLSVAAVIGGLLAFGLTRDRKYLGFSWQVFRFAVLLGLLMMTLLVLERLAVVVL